MNSNQGSLGAAAAEAHFIPAARPSRQALTGLAVLGYKVITNRFAVRGTIGSLPRWTDGRNP